MNVPKAARERAGKLRALLTHHAHRYYTLDAPEISDSAYDALAHELLALEAQYPALRDTSSPTERIIGGALPELKKVRHAVAQWSFNDAFTEEDIKAFDERVQRFLGTKATYDLELKIDGLKVVCTYTKGALALAATRGGACRLLRSSLLLDTGSGLLPLRNGSPLTRLPHNTQT